MKKSFFVNSYITKKGLTLKTSKGAYELIYPPEIWQAYPKDIKDTLKDNLTFLLTINLPLVAGLQRVDYNTSLPFFLPFFFEIITEGIPSAVEDYDYSTQSILKQFLRT